MVKEKLNYELDCRYDSRKSFYNKAKVYEFEDGSSALKSYSTIVACIIKKGDGTYEVYVRGSYSSTTTRHIKEYLKQNGFKANTLSQILKDYGQYDELWWDEFMNERGLWH